MSRPTARTTPNRSSDGWGTVSHVRRKVLIGYIVKGIDTEFGPSWIWRTWRSFWYQIQLPVRLKMVKQPQFWKNTGLLPLPGPYSHPEARCNSFFFLIDFAALGICFWLWHCIRSVWLASSSFATYVLCGSYLILIVVVGFVLSLATAISHNVEEQTYYLEVWSNTIPYINTCAEEQRSSTVNRWTYKSYTKYDM